MLYRHFVHRVSAALIAVVAAACGPMAVGGDTASGDVSADAPFSSNDAADAASVTDAAGACVALTRTCAQVMSTFASNSMSVTVTCDAAAGTFTMHSTGVPNYTSNQSTPNAIADQGWVVTLPLRATCAASTIDVVSSRGPVGFMINGVPFYGPQDANGHDAVVNEGPSFDDCEGHADQSCSYHYHEQPLCVFGVHDTAGQHLESDGHAAVIGYALDGFAIYASDPTASPLDGCIGHSDAVRGYHYHSTSTSPYLLGCYRGTRSGQVMRAMALCSTGGPTDGGVATDAGGGPRACTVPTDCTGACPTGSIGCTCAPGPTGGSNCVPTCASSADCPAGPMGTLTCDTTRHICHP